AAAAAPAAAAPAAAAAAAVTIPAERVDPTERATRLKVIADEVAACTACRLHSTRTQTVFARGNGSSGLCFVGEGPGADEDAQGFPFVRARGQLLHTNIAPLAH